ncbi:hypothetical protein PRIC1_008760 [Phytophthora ramorum]
MVKPKVQLLTGSSRSCAQRTPSNPCIIWPSAPPQHSGRTSAERQLPTFSILATSAAVSANTLLSQLLAQADDKGVDIEDLMMQGGKFSILQPEKLVAAANKILKDYAGEATVRVAWTPKFKHRFGPRPVDIRAGKRASDRLAALLRQRREEGEKKVGEEKVADPRHLYQLAGEEERDENEDQDEGKPDEVAFSEDSDTNNGKQYDAEEESSDAALYLQLLDNLYLKAKAIQNMVMERSNTMTEEYKELHYANQKEIGQLKKQCVKDLATIAEMQEQLKVVHDQFNFLTQEMKTLDSPGNNVPSHPSDNPSDVKRKRTSPENAVNNSQPISPSGPESRKMVKKVKKVKKSKNGKKDPSIWSTLSKASQSSPTNFDSDLVAGLAKNKPPCKQKLRKGEF